MWGPWGAETLHPVLGCSRLKPSPSLALQRPRPRVEPLPELGGPWGWTAVSAPCPPARSAPAEGPVGPLRVWRVVIGSPSASRILESPASLCEEHFVLLRRPPEVWKGLYRMLDLFLLIFVKTFPPEAAY